MTVTIDGTVQNVMAGSLHISRAVGRATEASSELWTDTGVSLREYSQVTVTDDATGSTIFTGYLISPKAERPGILEHSVSFVDQTWLAQKRRVAASFSNQTGGAIARYLLTNILSQEGCTTGQIYDGATCSSALILPFTCGPAVGLIPETTLSYCSVAEALDAIVQAISDSGIPFYWMIDHNKKVYFVPYTAITNSTIIDGTAIDDTHSPPSVTRNNPTFRTTQYVLGGTAQTSSQTETRKGDGNTIAWPMKYALSTAPTITVNSIAKTVGINGVDSGKDFYWNKGDQNITQDISATKLTSSDTLQVIYIGQYPNVTMLQDNSLVSAQAAIDGTSGIIEDVVSDETLTSIASALARATALLARYGVKDVSLLQFQMRQNTYSPGQLVTVNLPDFNLNNVQMLIESVEVSDSNDSLNMWYTVNAIQGPYDTNWSNFFSKLLATPKTANAVNVGLSQSVTILQSLAATIAPKVSLSVLVITCPLCSTSTLCSTATIVC